MFVAVALLSATLGVGGNSPIELPDVRDGVINGRVAVMILPQIVRADGSRTPLSSQGCTAHLIPFADNDQELVFPCGRWFQPPIGPYVWWVEKDHLISREQLTLTYNGGPFKGKGLGALSDVVPAGVVRLKHDIPQGYELWLMHLNSHLSEGHLGYPFERRVSSSRGLQGVPMPAGQVIAGLLAKDGSFRALSKPLSVAKGETVEVSLASPQNGSDVIAILERPRREPNKKTTNLALQLIGATEPRPHIFIPGWSRFIAIWYAVDGRKAQIQGVSDTLRFTPEQVVLQQGKVITVRRDLQHLPSLTVSVVTGAAIAEPLSLTITRLGDKVPVRQVDVSPRSEHKIDLLPAEELRCALHVGRWKLFRDVDLRDGDAVLTIEIVPLVVSGTVRVGDRPAKANVRFLNGTEWVETLTDDIGRYEVTLWEPGHHSVEIEYADQQGPPYREFFIPINASMTVDFDIPRPHHSVKVIDRYSNAPVSGARVTSTSTFQHRTGLEQTISQTTTTDDSGNAHLPPLRPGPVELNIEAAGFAKATKTLHIFDTTPTQQVVVPIEREDAVGHVAVRLSDGTPASHAEAAAIIAGEIVWEGRASSDGTFDLPEHVNGLMLLFRHERGAPVIMQWRKDHAEKICTLAPIGPPLTIRALRRTGEPLKFGTVTVWFGETPLSGAALHFALRTTPMTNQHGLWSAINPPAAPMRVAIREVREANQPPIFLVQAISFPWVSPVLYSADQ